MTNDNELKDNSDSKRIELSKSLYAKIKEILSKKLRLPEAESLIPLIGLENIAVHWAPGVILTNAVENTIEFIFRPKSDDETLYESYEKFVDDVVLKSIFAPVSITISRA